MPAPNRCRAHVCVRVARRVQSGGGAVVAGVVADTWHKLFFMAGALACGFGGEPFNGLEGKARRATLELNASLAMFENLGSLFSQTALVPVREINSLNFQTSPNEERSKECKNAVTKERKK